MRRSAQTLLSLSVAALAAVALVIAAGWPPKTALYPRVIGIPLLALATTEFILSLRGKDAQAEDTTMDFTLSGGLDPHVTLRRTVGMFAWILGFFLAIVLLGFPYAIPLFVLMYLKAQAQERWPLALALAPLAWLAFYALFVRLLHLPFQEGLLFRVLK